MTSCVMHFLHRAIFYWRNCMCLPHVYILFLPHVDWLCAITSVLTFSNRTDRFSPRQSVPNLVPQVFQWCTCHHWNWVHPLCCWLSLLLFPFPFPSIIDFSRELGSSLSVSDVENNWAWPFLLQVKTLGWSVWWSVVCFIDCSQYS